VGDGRPFARRRSGSRARSDPLLEQEPRGQRLVNAELCAVPVLRQPDLHEILCVPRVGHDAPQRVFVEDRYDRIPLIVHGDHGDPEATGRGVVFREVVGGGDIHAVARNRGVEPLRQGCDHGRNGNRRLNDGANCVLLTHIAERHLAIHQRGDVVDAPRVKGEGGDARLDHRRHRQHARHVRQGCLPNTGHGEQSAWISQNGGLQRARIRQVVEWHLQCRSEQHTGIRDVEQRPHVAEVLRLGERSADHAAEQQGSVVLRWILLDERQGHGAAKREADQIVAGWRRREKARDQAAQLMGAQRAILHREAVARIARVGHGIAARAQPCGERVHVQLVAQRHGRQRIADGVRHGDQITVPRRRDEDPVERPRPRFPRGDEAERARCGADLRRAAPAAQVVSGGRSCGGPGGVGACRRRAREGEEEHGAVREWRTHVAVRGWSPAGPSDPRWGDTEARVGPSRRISRKAECEIR
jgi:hypothetical protein